MEPDHQVSHKGTALRDVLLPGLEWSYYVLGVLLLGIPISTVVMVLRLYYDVPWGDHISLFFANRLQEGLTFEKLFRFHNEHQIVWTKLLIYSDYAFLHGSNILPYAATTLTILAICLFYCYLMRRFGNLGDRRKVFVACCLLVALYFNGRMLWTITSPILFEHPSTALLSLLAFYAFSRLPFALAADPPDGKKPRLPAIVLVIVLAVGYAGAATSSATGVLAGPAMLLVFCAFMMSRPFVSAGILKIGAVAVVATVVVASTYVAAYYNSATGVHAHHQFADFTAGAHFLFVFVGAAFFRDSTWPIAAHPYLFIMYPVAILFWSVLIWIAVQLNRRRHDITGFEIFHACVIVFVVLAGATGGLFRSDLSSLEGINKKYAPIALLAWISAASLVIYLRPRALFGVRTVSWARPLSACSLAILLILPGDLTEFRAWRYWERQVQEAAATIASGVYSENLMKRFYPDDAEAYQVARQFMQDHAYCYKRMPSPGYFLRDRLRVVDGSSENLNAEISPFEERPDMTGFTAAGSSLGLPNVGFPALVVTNWDGRVIGYGNVSNVAPGGVPTGKARAWFAAFRVPTRGPEAPVRVYEIDETTASLIGDISLPARPPARSAAHSSAVGLLRVPDHKDYAIELLDGVRDPIIKPPVRVPISGEVALSGWAADRSGGTSVAGLDVLIDRVPYQAQLGLSRPDIAAYFKEPGLIYTGFSFSMPASKLASGQHELRLRLYTNAGRSYLETRVYPFFIQ